MIEAPRDYSTHLHHDDGLLYDVADTGSNELQQNVHASLGRSVNLDRGLSYRLDAPPYKSTSTSEAYLTRVNECDLIVRSLLTLSIR